MVPAVLASVLIAGVVVFGFIQLLRRRSVDLPDYPELPAPASSVVDDQR
ncbi:MAG: hypothetical protein R3C52_05475 [Hyphomonadaceae bacterium]